MTIIPKWNNPQNDRLRGDLIKFLIHLQELATPELVHTRYIIEKVSRILDGNVIWHQSIENAYHTGSQYETPEPDLFSSEK